MILRPATAADLPALSALCLRSKAHWGYDAAFIDACRAELTLTTANLEAFAFKMAAAADGTPLAVAAVGRTAPIAELELMFVDPPAMGRGLGRRLFGWACATARKAGATRMRIEADPGARPFYERMGAVVTGDAASGSVPGRRLPVLHLDL